MELTIPYKYTAIDITTKQNGDLVFTLVNDTSLHQSILQQVIYNLSFEEVIQAIGSKEFEGMIGFYHTEFEKDN